MSLLNCFLGSQSRKLHGISCSFEGYPLRNFFFLEAQKAGEFLRAICIVFVPYAWRKIPVH